MALKLSDIVKNYEDSAISGDFSEWLQKVEFVAKLQKIKDLETFFPLILTGPVFAVYKLKYLSKDLKSNFSKLTLHSYRRFGVSKFTVYEQLQRRLLREGESVDVYVADEEIGHIDRTNRSGAFVVMCLCLRPS